MQHKGIYPKIKIGAVIDFQPNYFKFVSRFAGSTGGEELKKRMRGIITYEESQAVTKAFRQAGHEFYSCDILPCSGGHPEWHLQMDAIEALHTKGPWDFVGSHYPCTRLTNSGVCWLEKRNLWEDMRKAAHEFTLVPQFIKDNGVKGYVENPIPHKYAVEIIGKYSQIIQPWMFGHPERKATCLWLYGLTKLVPTNNVKAEMMKLSKAEQQRIHYLPPSPERAKLRSKTFEGIAQAMADQWG